MRRMTRSAALAAVLALVLAACSGGGEEPADTTAPPPDTTAPADTPDTTQPADDGDTTDSTEPEADAATQSDILVRAFQEEPQVLGLDPFEAPDYAYDIVEVDTSQYKKDGPRRIAFAIQAPEFSWPATYNDAVTARMEEAYPDSELILSPLTDVRGPIERATAQGIPVLLCTGTAETDAYVTRVDRDNLLNGMLGAEWIAREIGYEGNIVLLGGPAGVPTAEARLEGAMAVFSKYPDINILGQEYTNWDAADGRTA